MSAPTLYLFDGNNLLHAGGFADRRELRDALASWVAGQGVRGVLVFDGHGVDETLGPLEVRYAPHADTLVERLAAENREQESVLVVSSDAVLRQTAGASVGGLKSTTFLRGLVTDSHREDAPSRVAERLDPETRARLERLRRGQSD